MGVCKCGNVRVCENGSERNESARVCKCISVRVGECKNASVGV